MKWLLVLLITAIIFLIHLSSPWYWYVITGLLFVIFFVLAMLNDLFKIASPLVDVAAEITKSFLKRY